jgi:hypothetical protein
VAGKRDEPDRAIRRATIRMPTDLPAALMQRREETGQSLNDLLVEAAAQYVGIGALPIKKGIPGRKPARGANGGTGSG